MKKNVFILALILGCSVFCQAQLNKVALISVYGSRNLTDNELEKAAYEVLMKDTSFNILPIIIKFEQNVQNKFFPQLPFPFVPKEQVLNAPGYKELSDLTYFTKAKQEWSVTPSPGYIPLASFGILDDTEAIKKSFSLLPSDVDGVMVCFIEFKLYESVGIGGMSSKKIYAYVNMKIFNKDGKQIFKLKERASSSKGIMAVGGIITDVKKVLPLVNDAADKLFEEMQERLPKALAKLAKNIEKYQK